MTTLYITSMSMYYLLTLTFVLFCLSSYSAHYFSASSGLPRKLIFMGPHILTQLEGICKKIKNLFCLNFFTADFWVFFLPFTASIQSRKPGPTLVPGVFWQSKQQTQQTGCELFVFKLVSCVSWGKVMSQVRFEFQSLGPNVSSVEYYIMDKFWL